MWKVREVPGITIFHSSATIYFANAELYLEALKQKVHICFCFFLIQFSQRTSYTHCFPSLCFTLSGMFFSLVFVADDCDYRVAWTLLRWSRISADRRRSRDEERGGQKEGQREQPKDRYSNISNRLIKTTKR